MTSFVPAGFLDDLGQALCEFNLACEDNESVVSVDGSLPVDLTAAIAKVRAVMFLECPGCSDACGNSVRHYPPLCDVSRISEVTNQSWRPYEPCAEDKHE